MLAQERHHRILEKINETHSVKVAELIEEFRVSIETVRRDLEYLESMGKLKRVHGGAILEKDNSVEQSFVAREIIHVEEKLSLSLIS